MKHMIKKEIHVHCPKCSFKRLFDLVEEPAAGRIKIKCPCCKTTVELNLEHIYLSHQEKRLKGYKTNEYNEQMK